MVAATKYGLDSLCGYFLIHSLYLFQIQLPDYTVIDECMMIDDYMMIDE